MDSYSGATHNPIPHVCTLWKTLRHRSGQKTLRAFGVMIDVKLDLASWSRRHAFVLPVLCTWCRFAVCVVARLRTCNGDDCEISSCFVLEPKKKKPQPVRMISPDWILSVYDADSKGLTQDKMVSLGCWRQGRLALSFQIYFGNKNCEIDWISTLFELGK